MLVVSCIFFHDVSLLSVVRGAYSSLGNKEAISSHLEQRDIPLFTFPALPEKDVPLHSWFEETESGFDALFCSMMEKEEVRIELTL